MNIEHEDWRAGTFIAGATYRVIRENDNGRVFKVGEEWVFWYSTYSPYDGLGFVFFVSPQSFYPAAGARVPTDLKEANSVGWELVDTTLMDRWYEYWALVEAPRPGRMWVVEAWQRMMEKAEADFQNQSKLADKQKAGPKRPKTPILKPKKRKK